MSRQYDNEIVDGMETILWGDAWASHAEEHECVSLSGKQIEKIMPPAPKAAREMAKDLAKKYERANSESVTSLYEAAKRADDKAREAGQRIPKDLPMRFGENLAYMAMGAGVSWWDDHAEFPLKTPHIENYDLRIYADDHCPDPGNPACKECGNYNAERRSRCENCGKAL